MILTGRALLEFHSVIFKYNTVFSFPLEHAHKFISRSHFVFIYGEQTRCTVQYRSVGIVSSFRRHTDVVYPAGHFLSIFQPSELIFVWWKIFGKAGEGNLLIFLINGGRHFESWQLINHTWKTNTYTNICLQKQGIKCIYMQKPY